MRTGRDEDCLRSGQDNDPNELFDFPHYTSECAQRPTTAIDTQALCVRDASSILSKEQVQKTALKPDNLRSVHRVSGELGTLVGWRERLRDEAASPKSWRLQPPTD